MCCRIQIAIHLFSSAIYFILCLRTSCWTTRRSQRAGPISPDPRQLPGAIGPCRWHGDGQHSTWWPRSHPPAQRLGHAAPLGQRPDPTMAWDPGAVSLPAFDPHLGNSTGSVSLLGSKHRGQGLRGRPALWAGSCCSSWARLSSQELEFRTPRGYAALTLLGRGHLK